MIDEKLLTTRSGQWLVAVGGEGALASLAGEWDQLAGAGMTDTPFQWWAYQQGWWRHLGPAGADLYTITARDESGNLQAIGCFYRLDGVLYFNGCVEETDYLDLVAPAANAEQAWTAVFDALTHPDFPAWQALDLCNVPEHSPTLTILPRLAAGRGFVFQSAVHEVCPVIRLAGSFDNYLMGLDKKQRHEIRRKLRRAAGAELAVTAVDGRSPEDGAELTPAVDLFLDLLGRSTPEKGAWLNDGRRALFHEVAAAAAERGALQLLFAGVRGEQAAALFNFDYRDRIWVYNSGLDPAAFGHLSPGVVLTAEAIRLAVENGRSLFDFLRGDELYKYRFGAVNTCVYRLQLRRAG